VSFSADRKRVVSNSPKSGVLVSDTDQGNAVLALPDGPPAVVMTPDGRGILFGSWGNGAPLELRDVVTGKVSRGLIPKSGAKEIVVG
jgi:hypothetical protein